MPSLKWQRRPSCQILAIRQAQANFISLVLKFYCRLELKWWLSIYYYTSHKSSSILLAYASGKRWMYFVRLASIRPCFLTSIVESKSTILPDYWRLCIRSWYRMQRNWDAKIAFFLTNATKVKRKLDEKVRDMRYFFKTLGKNYMRGEWIAHSSRFSSGSRRPQRWIFRIS